MAKTDIFWTLLVFVNATLMLYLSFVEYRRKSYIRSIILIALGVATIVVASQYAIYLRNTEFNDKATAA